MKFYLCVDNFEIIYNSKDNTNPLLNVLCQYYNIPIDCDGQQNSGLILQWNYNTHHINIAISEYINKVLHKF